MKKKQQIARSLEIRIYWKTNDTADVVFRKDKVLYRLGVVGALRFMADLAKCLVDLAIPQVMQFEANRLRKMILEMGLLDSGNAMLALWEMAESEMKARFGWEGEKADLVKALSR